MAMLGQSSFRRILLTRVLLLSIPILLLGVAVTFRKARTSLLYTARINLTASATRKAEMVQSTIQAMRSSLAIASDNTVLRSGDSREVQAYLTHLVAQLPTDVQCLQLVDLEAQQPVASTCGDRHLTIGSTTDWATQYIPSNPNRFQVYNLEPKLQQTIVGVGDQSHLELAMSVPVYAPDNQLRYSLNIEFAVRQLDNSAPWSLIGNTIIIDQSGRFLAHPDPRMVGKTIDTESDVERFNDILQNGQRGESAVRHLRFRGDSTEWLAGFSPIVVTTNPNQNQIWTVLAITPLNNALKGLETITQILIIITTGLLAAHLLAMLYIARDLSLPIEQLGKYARRIHKRSPLERAPKNFRIRELNHLAEALDNMVSRLEERARELETAWQEAEAANQLKSEFLANTSHELRTPLNAIIGCIRLVRDGCCDTREEETEFLGQADKAAVHLLKIINDLLDIRRMEEAGLSLTLEILDFHQILNEVLELQSVQIQQKGLQLIKGNFSTPIWVQADPARLKQVLLNIIYNATKFTDRGSITVETRLETPTDTLTPDGTTVLQHDTAIASPPSGSWLVVSVRDTGIGIDPAQQHKLFRPFVMIDGTTTRKFEGTGLGLAISRNLIEMMGGSIALHSDGLNQGTTVEITLPMAEKPLDPSFPLATPGKPVAVTDSNELDTAEAMTEHSAIGS